MVTLKCWLGLRRLLGLALLNQEVFGLDYDAERIERLALEVKQAAYKIIEGKEYTNFVIGAVIMP
ncbi:hypothetical protein [Agarivorans sp. QJM3NY_33]|uniref:hypothetical protein n=1 Tax=Agarivorans sp. QJM3NY_33 TaxID=3421432 RepID=UPI003D7E814B